MMSLRWALLLGGLAVVPGCSSGPPPEGLQPLATEGTRDHNTEESCSGHSSVAASPKVDDVALSYELPQRELFAFTADRCGNVALVYPSSSDQNVVVRVLANGRLDWEVSWKPINAPWVRPTAVAADEYGNVVALADDGLQLMTAEGAVYGGVPSGGLEIGGSRLVQLGTAWVVGADSGFELVPLPNAPKSWSTREYDGEFDSAFSQNVSEALWDVTSQSLPYPAYPGEHEIVVRKYPSWSGERVEYPYVVPEDATVVFSQVFKEYRSSVALAEAIDRVVLAATFLGPRSREPNSEAVGSHSCERAVLINILTGEDEFELSECGFIQGLDILSDGSVLSLWSVEIDDTGFRPLALHTDAQGRELNRWDMDSLAREGTAEVGNYGFAVLRDKSNAIIASIDKSTLKLTRITLD